MKRIPRPQTIDDVVFLLAQVEQLADKACRASEFDKSLRLRRILTELDTLLPEALYLSAPWAADRAALFAHPLWPQAEACANVIWTALKSVHDQIPPLHMRTIGDGSIEVNMYAPTWRFMASFEDDGDSGWHVVSKSHVAEMGPIAKLGDAVNLIQRVVADALKDSP